MDPPSLFIDGEEVEVTSQEPGFEGCWFKARVVGKSTNKINTFWVEYQDEQRRKPLKKYVELKNIRPLQPQGPPRLFKENEEVDAFHNGGWWKGIIAEVLQNSCYKVEFEYSNEKINFKQSEIRPHLEWIDGNWANLAQQNQEVTVVELDERNGSFPNPTASPSCSTSMKRKRGCPKGSGKRKMVNTSGFQNLRIISPLKVTESEAGMDVTNGGINQCQVLCLSSLEKPLIVENNEDVQVALDKSMDERDTPLDSAMDLQQLSIVPQNSPLEKTSATWNSLEGSEIFKSQNPHFLPIENVREKVREERALTYMLRNESLVKSTNKASIEEEKDVFEDQLGSLNELEKNGFKDKLDEVGNMPDSSKLEKAKNEPKNLMWKQYCLELELQFFEKLNVDNIPVSLEKLDELQQMLLFEKTSVRWNSLEGWEIFKSQNPHFLPLENVREKFLEERALTNKASIEEERDVFEYPLALLKELEEKIIEIKEKRDEVGNRPDSSKLEMEKAKNEIKNLRREIEILFEKLER